MEMSHGDAIMILKKRRSSKTQKLLALDYLLNNEMVHDMDCIPKPVMWDLVKFLFKELTHGCKDF